MNTEYYITRMSENVFKVAKFSGGEQPENVYYVTMKKVTGFLPSADPNSEGKEYIEMRCDCPNRRRGRGTNDKHGQMVAKWLLAGEPTCAMNEKGEFNETRRPHDLRIRDEGGVEDEDDDDSDPFGLGKA